MSHLVSYQNIIVYARIMNDAVYALTSLEIHRITTTVEPRIISQVEFKVFFAYLIRLRTKTDFIKNECE